MGSDKNGTYVLGREIYLYQLAESKKGNWYCRFKDPTKSVRYVRKSLKTSDQGLATSRAIDLYNDIQTRVRLGSTRIATGWDDIYQTFYDELNPKTAHKVDDINERHWRVWFNNSDNIKDIFKITDEHMKSYWKWRCDFWINNPKNRHAAPVQGMQSITTLEKEKSYLKFFLSRAFHRKMIGQMPMIDYQFRKNPNVLVRDGKGKRGRFDEKSMKPIRAWWKYTRRMLNETRENGLVLTDKDIQWGEKRDLRSVFNNSRNRYCRASLYTITITSANTGLRSYELVRLRWKDIQKFDDEDGTRFSVINVRQEVAKTKRSRDAISRDYHLTYDRLMEFKLEWAKFFKRVPDGEDFVFANPLSPKDESKQGKPHQSIRAWLLSLKDEDGNVVYYQDRDGIPTPRTLYSFRSLYITEALKRGVEPYTLARAVGTSLEMLEKHYDYNKNLQFRNDITQHRVGMEFDPSQEPKKFD